MSDSASSHRVLSAILLGLGLLVPIGKSWGAPHGGEIQTSLPALEPLAKASAGSPDSVRKITGLILLVEFPDVRGTFSRLAVDSMANQPGYNKYSNFGSIRDYWLDISHGKLDYSLVVTQYYLARNNKSYYDRAGGYEGAKELIREALLGLDAKGFDFSGLTTSSTGSVRGLNVLYAGSFGGTWGQGIWPHRGNISSITLDGVKLNSYQLTGLTSSLSIGTIAHENGHLLFNWPDLYDYDSDSRGTGAYCLMSGQNSKNPQPPNAYFRAGQGWDTLVDMKSLQNGLVSVPSNWHKAYKYVNPANTRELFVIESILKKGRWTNVPDEGLLIWHVADRPFQAGRHTLDMGTLSKGAYRLSISGDGRSAASGSRLLG